VREFVSYCGSLINFTVGGVLISGLDLAIVGHFRFPDVVAYSAAATLVMFLAGINQSVFNSLLAPAARYHTSGEKKRLGELVSYATRAAVFLNVFVGLPLVVLARPLLRLWVGDDYAATAAPILQVLVGASTIRLVFVPFGVAVLATGEQQRIILWPILEGLVNLTASIFGVIHWGSIGVAFGTLVGAIFSLVWVYFYNLRQVKDICLDRAAFLRDSLLRPVCCFLPVAVLFPLFGPIPADSSWLPLSLSLCLSIMVIARWGRLGRPGAWVT
jgi:O-antigen/teichoic acid export membrane protein